MRWGSRSHMFQGEDKQVTDYPFLGVPRTEMIISGPTVPARFVTIHPFSSKSLTEHLLGTEHHGGRRLHSGQPARPTDPALQGPAVSVGAKSVCSPCLFSHCNPTSLLSQLPEKRIRCTKNKRAAEQVHFKFLVRLKNKNHSIPMSSRNPGQRVWPEACGHCGAYRWGSGKMENSAALRRVAGRAWTKRGRAGKRGSESFLVRSTGWSRSLRRRTLRCSLTGSICWPLPENKVLCYWVKYSPAQASGFLCFTVKMLLVQPPEKLSQSRRYSTLVL